MKKRDESTQKKTTGAFKAFAGFLHGSKRLIAISAVAITFAIFCSYIVPQITRVTIDSLIGDEPLGKIQSKIVDLLGGVEYLRSHIIIVGALIVGVVLIQLSIAFVRRLSSLQTSVLVTKKIKDDMFIHIQKLPYSWHMSVQTGDIIQRSTQDADLIGRYMSAQFIEFLRVIVMLAVGIPLMMWMNAIMTIVVISFIPVVAVYSGVVFPKIANNFKKAEEAEGDLTARLQENLTGVRVVRAFGQQSAETLKFKEKNEKYVSLWLRLGNMLSLYWSSGDFLGGLQLLTILISGAILTVNGTITIGTMLTFITYSQMLIWPVRNIGRILAETGKVKIAVKRLTEVLDAVPEDENILGIMPQIKGGLEFKNVTFGYNSDRVILNDVSFDIKQGEVLGILGSTGSGKSTLVQLISRLYDPQKGEILIDGINIKDINLPYLRSNIGLILQEPFLFSKTVKDNISIAAGKNAEGEVIKYAAIANVDGAISEFKNGYDTMIGEKGVTLSGGQKQRIAIARTLIGKPAVLIFDDSLSAVDTDTDFKIRSSLKKNLSGTTMILISHRITTLMGADKILVMDEGRILDSGTHSELVSRDGVYKRVYQLQTLAFNDEKENAEGIKAANGKIQQQEREA